jgi:hypothetical protein
MSTQFFTKLSQNYIELLKDDEYYDITIEGYIYGGMLSLNVNNTSDFLNILAVVDKLHPQELVDYLQKYLIGNKAE